MNFIFATTPIRQTPTPVPPTGITSLMETLIEAGYNPKLYDIDALRPAFEQVTEFFKREKPHILGISARVSTSYRYVKDLTHVVKKVSPRTKIIVGSHLAASAEILLRKCPVDLCVIGEGEITLMNLVKYWEKYHDFDYREELEKIKGLAFINARNDFIFTGYEKQLPPEKLRQPNYEILEKFSNINSYILDNPQEIRGFKTDRRSYQPHRLGQKFALVMTGRGCTHRCTFCHRWELGYRSFPVENIINTMKYLKKKFNVGFFSTDDENFGANLNILNEFIEAVKPLDSLFRIAGIRIASVYRDLGVIHRLKEAGCCELTFGMESGSDKILTIMEKGVTRSQNIEVAKTLVKENMYPIHQFVIGMPGESENTIRETIECLKKAVEGSEIHPIISTNYFQALPGSPGYEYIRLRGLIGKTLDDEEAYLLKISDVNAGSHEHYINVSEEPLSKVYLWQHKIRVEATIHWYKSRNWKPAAKTPDFVWDERGFKGIWRYISTRILYFRLVSILGGFYWWALLFFVRIRFYGIIKAILIMSGLKEEEDRGQYIIKEPKSLRKMIAYPDARNLSVSEANVLPLRMGR